MRRTILIYGLMAVLIGLLKLVEYRYLVRDVPLEFYIGLVAVMFTALGIGAGLRLTRPKVIETSGPFERDERSLHELGIRHRKLRLMYHLSYVRASQGTLATARVSAYNLALCQLE